MSDATTDDVALIEAAVREFFESDEAKVRAWFDTPNPHLGNVAPRLMMMRPDSLQRLKNFVMDAADAERAAGLQRSSW